MDYFWMFLLSSAIRACYSTNEVDYKITTLQNSTGLYYEHLGPARRVTGTWRITVFFNVNKLNNSLHRHNEQLLELKTKCDATHKTQCYDIIKDSRVISKLTITSRLQQQIDQETSELSRQTERKYPSILPQGMRSRRATPMLGFLGGIIGPVAGLLTYDDEKKIEEEIMELNQAETNISHLVGQQTHVIRSQLEDLHKHAEFHDKELNRFKLQFFDALKRVNEMAEYFHPQNYTETIKQVLRASEDGLDHYIYSAERILSVIHAARKGELHPTLLTSQQMLPVFRDVQDNAPQMMFPVIGSTVDIDEITKIVKPMVTYRNGILNLILDIPLLGRTKYQTYKINSVPVPKPILKNGTGKAYIQSRFSHILKFKEHIFSWKLLISKIVNKYNIITFAKEIYPFLKQ